MSRLKLRTEKDLRHAPSLSSSASQRNATHTRIRHIFDDDKPTTTMMKLALVALLAGSAAAFAPASSTTTQSSSRSASALRMFEDKAGVLQPTGYFDPLGLATSEEIFDSYRVVEKKHGRVAMLAVIGYVVPEFFRFSGDIAPGLKFADIPNGVAAINAVPALGWLQIFFFVGAVDFYGFLGDFEMVSGICGKMGRRWKDTVRHRITTNDCARVSLWNV